MGGGGVARRRASVKVEFSVKVANEAAANAGVTKLNTFLTTGTQFKDALKAKGGALANVTGTKVTKAPVAKKTDPVVSGVAATAAMSFVSMGAVEPRLVHGAQQPTQSSAYKVVEPNHGAQLNA